LTESGVKVHPVIYTGAAGHVDHNNLGQSLPWSGFLENKNTKWDSYKGMSLPIFDRKNNIELNEIFTGKG